MEQIYLKVIKEKLKKSKIKIKNLYFLILIVFLIVQPP